MSAYNQYLAEIKKVDNEIAQRHFIQQQPIQKLRKIKKLISDKQSLLSNFKGVINELKLSDYNYDVNDFEKLLFSLELLNNSLSEAKSIIKIPSIKYRINELLSYCRNEMILSEINDKISLLTVIKEEENKFQQLKKLGKKTERFIIIDEERYNEYFIHDRGMALDKKTDLLWSMFQETDSGWGRLSLNFEETLNKANNINIGDKIFYKYGDWRLPTVEEFKSLQEAINLKNHFENIVKYKKELKIYEYKRKGLVILGYAIATIATIISVIVAIEIFTSVVSNKIYYCIFFGIVSFIVAFTAIFIPIGNFIESNFRSDWWNHRNLYSSKTYLIRPVYPKDTVPITTGYEYWTSSPSIDEQHGQVCCRFEDKIISRTVLKSEKHHVTLVRNF